MPVCREPTPIYASLSKKVLTVLYIMNLSDKKNTVPGRFEHILTGALQGKEYEVIESPEQFSQWCAKPLSEREGTAFFFVMALPEQGMSVSYAPWLNAIISHPGCLEGCVGAVLVDGTGELFTKKIGREIIFVANAAGCSFPGKPLVEATGSLSNFNTLAQIHGLDNLAAYQKSVTDLLEKLLAFEPCPAPMAGKPNIVVLHASMHETSNTLLLWNMVRIALGDRATVEEISLRNGEIVDCRGCNYETCLHFGENGSCFYGGVIVDKAYPAIKRCDCIVFLSPNYNDALSANMTAFINRLTALFRTDFARFASKKIFALVVSGYSGGDIVAEQIIDAMNCNKNFILPGNFALVETANAPKSILQCEGIEERAKAMAERLLR